MQAITDIDFFSRQLQLEENAPRPVTKSVSSMTARNYIRHVWQLERYSTLTEEEYESACFSASGSKITWAIWLKPHVHLDGVADIEVYLKRKSNLRDDRICFRIELLDVDGNVCHSQQSLELVGLYSGWRRFYCIDDINVANRTLTAEGTFTLACDVYEVSGYTANPSHLQVRYPSNEKKAHGLFEQLLERCKGISDDHVTLIGKDDVTVEASKFILGARSAVLRAMFDTSMKEQRTKVVELRDVDGELLQVMVDFINTDTVSDLDRFAEPLLVLADRYQVLKLKMLCEEHLMQSISPSTISHFRSLARITNAPMLKKSCDVFSGHD